MISLAVYPSQFQCFRVTFHTLLKWECQRETIRQRPIHSSGAKVDRGLLVCTLNFSSSHVSLDPSLWRSWFKNVRFQSSSRTRQTRRIKKKKKIHSGRGFNAISMSGFTVFVQMEGRFVLKSAQFQKYPDSCGRGPNLTCFLFSRNEGCNVTPFFFTCVG